jgi:hypothetical protein
MYAGFTGAPESKRSQFVSSTPRRNG